MNAGPGFVVELLGTCRIVDAATGAAHELTPIQRRLVARLAQAGPVAVTFDELADAVWDDHPPATARAAITNQVSRLRERFGPELIRTAPTGYLLGAATDLDDVRQLVEAAERALVAGQVGTADELSSRAVVRMQAHRPDDDEARGIGELRRAAESLRLRSALAAGRIAFAVPEAERLVAATPYDEARWALLVEALEAAGRRGDALGAVDRARRTLAHDLGLGLGPTLRAAEARLLDAPPAAARSGAVERIARQTLLDEVVARVSAGRSVLLTGEVGIGKSALLDSAVRAFRSAGLRVARAGCVAHPHVPLAVLDDLLDDLGRRLGQAPDRVAAFLEAIAAAAGTSTPLVLAVDDAHHAGPTSVRALVRAARLPGVTVVATSATPTQETDDGAAAYETVDVPVLDRHETAVVAGELLGRPVEPAGELVEWLIEMSGGNPAILELVVGSVTVDSLDRAPQAVDTPVALRQLVRGRVAALGAIARRGIEVLAIHGQPMPRDLLADVAGDRAVPDGTAGGLLEWTNSTSGSLVQFRHRAVRLAVYDDIPPGHRAEIRHRLAGELRSRGAPAVQVAHHSMASGMAPRQAYDDVLAAADANTERGAHSEAARWHAAAIELTSVLGGEATARVKAMICYGDALRLAGDPDHEAAMFAAADEALALGEPSLIGEAAWAALQLGATTESGHFHTRGLALADIALNVVTDPEQWARVAAAASLAHSMTSSAERGRDLFLLAEQRARQPATRAGVLPLAYLSLGHPRDLDRRQQLTSELLTLGCAADDPVAMFEGHQMAFSVAVQRADGDAARAALAELRTLVGRVGDAGRRWAHAYIEAAVAHLDDDLDAAERWSETALALFQDVSASRAFAAYGGQLLPIRIAQGRLGELGDVLTGLVAEQPGVPAWNAALALALAPTDPDRAAVYAERALHAVPEDFTWLAAHVIGGRAAGLVGSPELVGTYRARLEPWSGIVCWQGTCAYGPVDIPLAGLATAAGDHTAAAHHRGLALELADRLRAPAFTREVIVG